MSDMNDLMNQIKATVHPKGKGKLKEGDINNILEFLIDITQLEKHGITPKKYNDKFESYMKFRKKAYEEYGLELSFEFPFKHPTKLQVEIYNILRTAGLNNKQIKAFYALDDVLIKPDKATIERHNKKIESYIITTLTNMKENFTEEEISQKFDEAMIEKYDEMNEDFRKKMQEEEREYNRSQIEHRYKFSRILKNSNKN